MNAMEGSKLPGNPLDSSKAPEPCPHHLENIYLRRVIEGGYTPCPRYSLDSVTSYVASDPCSPGIGEGVHVNTSLLPADQLSQFVGVPYSHNTCPHLEVMTQYPQQPTMCPSGSPQQWCPFNSPQQPVGNPTNPLQQPLGNLTNLRQQAMGNPMNLRWKAVGSHSLPSPQNHHPTKPSQQPIRNPTNSPQQPIGDPTNSPQQPIRNPTNSPQQPVRYPYPINLSQQPIGYLYPANPSQQPIRYPYPTNPSQQPIGYLYPVNPSQQPMRYLTNQPQQPRLQQQPSEDQTTSRKNPMYPASFQHNQLGQQLTVAQCKSLTQQPMFYNLAYQHLPSSFPSQFPGQPVQGIFYLPNSNRQSMQQCQPVVDKQLCLSKDQKSPLKQPPYPSHIQERLVAYRKESQSSQLQKRLPQLIPYPEYKNRPSEQLPFQQQALERLSRDPCTTSGGTTMDKNVTEKAIQSIISYLKEPVSVEKQLTGGNNETRQQQQQPSSEILVPISESVVMGNSNQDRLEQSISREKFESCRLSSERKQGAASLPDLRQTEQKLGEPTKSERRGLKHPGKFARLLLSDFPIKDKETSLASSCMYESNSSSLPTPIHMNLTGVSVGSLDGIADIDLTLAKNPRYNLNEGQHTLTHTTTSCSGKDISSNTADVNSSAAVICSGNQRTSSVDCSQENSLTITEPASSIVDLLCTVDLAKGKNNQRTCSSNPKIPPMLDLTSKSNVLNKDQVSNRRYTFGGKALSWNIKDMRPVTMTNSLTEPMTLHADHASLLVEHLPTMNETECFIEESTSAMQELPSVKKYTSSIIEHKNAIVNYKSVVVEHKPTIMEAGLVVVEPTTTLAENVTTPSNPQVSDSVLLQGAQSSLQVSQGLLEAEKRIQAKDSSTQPSMQAKDSSTQPSMQAKDSSTQPSMQAKDSSTQPSMQAKDSSTQPSMQAKDSSTQPSMQAKDSSTQPSMQAKDSSTQPSMQAKDSSTQPSMQAKDSSTQPSMQAKDSSTQQSMQAKDSSTQPSMQAKDSSTQQSMQAKDSSIQPTFIRTNIGNIESTFAQRSVSQPYHTSFNPSQSNPECTTSHDKGEGHVKLNKKLKQHFSKRECIQDRFFLYVPPKPKLLCFLCGITVSGEEALYHLFFGLIKCAECNCSLTTCADFRNMEVFETPCKEQNKDHKKLVWSSDPIDFVSYHVRKNLMTENTYVGKENSPSTTDIVDAMAGFLDNFKALQTYSPWAQALYKCWNYVRNMQATSDLTPRVKTKSLQPFNGNLKNTENVQAVNLPTSDPTILRSDSCSEELVDSRHLELESKDFPLSQPYGQELLEQVGDEVNEMVNNNLTNDHISQPVVSLASPSSPTTAGDTINTRNLSSTEQRPSNINKPMLDLMETSRESPANTHQTTLENLPKTQNTSLCQMSKKRLFSALNSDSVPEKQVSFPSHSGPVDRNNFLLFLYPKDECPNECPMCYAALCASRCNVNLKTYVVRVDCLDCGLQIFIDLDPSNEPCSLSPCNRPCPKSKKRRTNVI
nr:uncharacterized protein LOC123771155 isoform X1 [Procambarus clarkii]